MKFGIKEVLDRHVVRHYDSKPLNKQHINGLNAYIDELNSKYDMHMQLMINEPKAFGGEKAKISNITGCVNYLVIAGKKTPDLEEKSGYVGEMVVLYAQSLGINSCWAKLTYDQQMDLYDIKSDEELTIVIALGYGTTQGRPHVSKKLQDVVVNKGELPEWFVKGVEMALLAPTGKNQQGFKFELLEGNKVKVTNESLCKEIDLGIIKLHFEFGAIDGTFKWA